MPIKLLLTFAFLCSTSIFHLTGKPDHIFYSHPLSLKLLSKGTDDFIEASKNEPEEEYKKALHDIIYYARFNQTDIPVLLKNINATLNEKIKAIEELPEETHTDYKQIALGVGAIGIGLGLSYALYKYCDNAFHANSQEREDIKESLAQKGVNINDCGTTINFELPQHISRSDIEQLAERYTGSKNNDSHLFGIQVCAVIWGPLVSVGYGGKAISYGLDPHADDKNLEKYKNMQAIIAELQKPDRPNYLKLFSKN